MDTTSARVMTIENCRVTCASAVDKKKNGANATMVVSTAKITGFATAEAPSTAASRPPWV